MFVDIHTHNIFSDDQIRVRNLSVTECAVVLENADSGLFSIGIHPWEIEKSDSNALDLLSHFAKNDRVVAIGECGLDKNITISFDKQLELFEKQIQISETIKKPLIIHCVVFFNELMALCKKIKPQQKWIVHAFRGKPQLAQQLLKSGISLSFADKFNPDSLKITPLTELYIETDESVIPIAEIYNRIAEIKNCDVSDLNAGYNLVKKYW